MFRYFLFTPLLFSQITQAKETWFSITGINQKNPAMNYESFYNESNAFLDVCKKDPNRDCRRYINPNSSLSPNSKNLVIGDNRGTPSYNRKQNRGILNEIETVIKNAKAGDRILISLNNHGGPGRDKAGRDLSCIFIQNGQKICDSDLARIIKDLPQKKGFQVAIVAEGCFSGGFNSLVNKNVCVATTSDQQRAAYGTRFWQSAREKSPVSLYEQAMKYSNGGNPYDQTMTASQYMENIQGCRATQQALTAGNTIQNIIAGSPLQFREDQLCSSNSGYRQLNQLTYSMQHIADSLSDPRKIQQICAASNEWCSVAQNLARNQNTFLQAKEYYYLIAEIQSLKSKMNDRIARVYSSVNADEVRAMSLIVNYEDRSLLQNLSPERQAQLSPLIESYRAFVDSQKNEIDSLFGRMSSLIKDWQNSSIASDLSRLTSCLKAPLPVESNDRTVLELEADAKNRKRLMFTEQDKLEARKCEQSFRM